MSKRRPVIDAALKSATIKRILSGEEVSALARELKLKRQTLYKWKDRYRKGGDAAFRVRRGPKPGSKPSVANPRTRPTNDLGSAKRRIAELERKIGQQQLELDFFRQALQQVREARRSVDGPGAKPSTPASRR